MDIKLVVFDLDGTLLNRDHQLDNKTIAALDLLRKKGIKTMVATGRMYCSAKQYTDKLNIKEPVITYNGALVVDPVKEKKIFHSPIPFKIAEEITKMVVKNKYHLQLYIDDKLYVEENNRLTQRYAEISGVEANAVGKLDKFLDSQVTKMLIIEENEEKQVEIKNFLKNNFADRTELSSSYPSFMEITKKGISKVVPLKKIAAEYKIKKEEIMAFGDGLNDLKMIDWVGKGVVMQNAHSELQQYADDTAPDNGDLGIARYLKQHFNLDLDI